jgi:hypothetical protein
MIEGCSKGCGWIKAAVSEAGGPPRAYTCAGHYLDDESRLFHVAGLFKAVHPGITAMWSDNGLIASWSQPWVTPAMARVAWGVQHDNAVALEEWTTVAEQLRKLVATLETSNWRHEKSRMSTVETQQ